MLGLKLIHVRKSGHCSWHRHPHISTHDVQNFVVKILRYTGLFYHFWMLRWHRQLKCSVSKDKNQFILHRQYYDHWWPVDSTSQGIYSHGIELVHSEYSRFIIRMVNPHDDVIKWKHFPCYWPFVRGIHWSPVNSLNKGQWRWALMFSLICVWINGWVNNREAGDLRRHRAHHNVIVMHTVQGLEYLEANWVNVMAGDALDPCIARSSTAMILIVQMGILMWSLRVNLNNLSLSSVWPQLTHCCLRDVAVILNIKLSNMFLWMISLVFPLNFAIR